MRNTGRYVLAAASLDAQEKDMYGHGVYTYALLEGLAGKADPDHTGVIEVDALADYVCTRVDQAAAERSRKPELGLKLQVACDHRKLPGWRTAASTGLQLLLEQQELKQMEDHRLHTCSGDCTSGRRCVDQV